MAFRAIFKCLGFLFCLLLGSGSPDSQGFRVWGLGGGLSGQSGFLGCWLWNLSCGRS